MAGRINANVADYHGAFDASGDNVILVNILRASEGLPLHFSFLNKINGNINESLQVGFSIPFGDGPATRRTSTPQFTATSNPTFDDDNLETENFTQTITNSIDQMRFKSFFDFGLDNRVGLLLTVSGMRVKSQQASDTLRNRSAENIENPIILNSPSSDRLVCYEGITNEEHLADIKEREKKAESSYWKIKPAKYFENYKIVTDLHECGESYFEPEFYSFLRLMNTIPPFFVNSYTEYKPTGPIFTKSDAVKAGLDKLAGLDTTKVTLVPQGNGRSFQLATISQRIAFCASSSVTGVLSLLRLPNDPRCLTRTDPLQPEDPRQTTNRLELISDAGLRSVAAMFNYVGEVVAWQKHAHDCVIVNFYAGPFEEGNRCDGEKFFGLEEGDPAGMSYSILYREKTLGIQADSNCLSRREQELDHARNCNHAAQVMSVLSLGLGLAIRPKDLPQTSLFQILP